jgi:hypothetical protein
MDQAGLINNIFRAVIDIDFGRKGFAMRSREHEGRISYEKGITLAANCFQEVQTSADPQTIVLVELTFLQQEFQFCDKADEITQSSLTQAIQSFEDALRCLKVVADKKLYRGAEATHPTSPRYRIHSFPKDAFHIACIAHKTRLQNILRSPGIDPMEKSLLKQRFANMTTAQNGYIEKQKKTQR